MIAWDTSADLMDKLRAFIQPVRAEEPLRQVLAHDFPRDSSNLPISGGWGYTQADAIVFVRELFPTPAAAHFVPLEYHIVQKLIYEELIIFKPHDLRFSGIEKKLNLQKLVSDDSRMYDHLGFSITCWSDWHWEQLKQEWEENNFGMSPDFDRESHAAKREASQINYEREFWFDVTDVFDLRQHQ